MIGISIAFRSKDSVTIVSSNSILCHMFSRNLAYNMSFIIFLFIINASWNKFYEIFACTLNHI